MNAVEHRAVEEAQLLELIGQAVDAIGGYNVVGYLLRPDLPKRKAGPWLRACLDPQRREKFGHREFFGLLKLAAEHGHHDLARRFGEMAGYKGCGVVAAKRHTLPPGAGAGDQEGGMTTLSVQLSLDTSPFEACLSALADAADGSLEIRQRLRALCDSGVQLAVINPEGLPAGAAGAIRYRLEPAECLAEVLAAVRAGSV
ncbi:hypothetical protein [Rubrivivax sp. JA1026]|uniref:hypothetical protein n=1 Tax=Rubrivivax sp. JA1026 TaxID=2710888 RepID=UPI0013E90F20|nr:hypothetical protein [Rubrivivax sp. JA1026]